jgi:predicted metalloprotease with PDZ domain
MQKLTLIVLLFLISSCSSLLKRDSLYGPSQELVYVVNLNAREGDTFKIKLYVDNLKDENAIYQFAASAPGTYQTMDLGRFVRSFKAYDVNGNEISSNHISTNQWEISQPENVHLIEYSIAETFDTAVDSNVIYPMAGSSIEYDHVLINGQCTFGYPSGMQKRPVKMKLLYPEEWIIGTALHLGTDGFYIAKDYDQVVDSPILAGQLTHAETDVRGTRVDLFVYSENGMVEAESILNQTDDILNAAADFTEGLPVDRYTFLFNLEDTDFPGGGAWEHNYSSIYVFSENDYLQAQSVDQDFPQKVMAHEFFHIITPLNIHSELVSNFNFVKPEPSRHLWLYEATTEWAAQIMQFRAGLMDINQYLKVLSDKLIIADHFRKDYSLMELSLNSFSNAGKGQYINVYQKGAVTIGLLDILLLDLSDGKRGLREVINELSEAYGPANAFDENTFFDTFTTFTFPEVETFINRYIKKAEPLPIAEYYSKIGITYNEQLVTDKIDTTGGYKVIFNDGKFIITQVDSQLLAKGLAENDIILAINNKTVSMQNIRELFGQIHAMGLEETYLFKIQRANEEKEIVLNKITKMKVEKHIFTVDENATDKQVQLRNAWKQNLKKN